VPFQGVSTRSVDDLVQAMGMSGISKSQVSRLCAEIDEKVHAFLDRPLEGDWPYVHGDKQRAAHHGWSPGGCTPCEAPTFQGVKYFSALTPGLEQVSGCRRGRIEGRQQHQQASPQRVVTINAGDVS
jgi:hypothetical protein